MWLLSICMSAKLALVSANLNFAWQLPRGSYSFGVPWPKHRELSSYAKVKQQTVNLGEIAVSPIRSFHELGFGAELDVPVLRCCRSFPHPCQEPLMGTRSIWAVNAGVGICPDEPGHAPDCSTLIVFSQTQL